MLRRTIPTLAGCCPKPTRCAALPIALRPLSRPFSSSPSTKRVSDDFVNIIQADAARPIPQIGSISPAEGFTLTDGLVLPSPVIFMNGVTFLWDVAPPPAEGVGWEGWSEEKLKIFEVVTPRPDILLFGTGLRGFFPPPHFKKYLNSLGIQVDVLDSRNACSTYNLLAEEGRRVAAALYPIAPLDSRTGKPWARA